MGKTILAKFIGKNFRSSTTFTEVFPSSVPMRKRTKAHNLTSTFMQMDVRIGLDKHEKIIITMDDEHREELVQAIKNYFAK
ncbi:MAG: hypothetical protein AAGG68_14775 [Bacteroidota bacterium]